MDAVKYVIDCDPGHDDAVAILYGAAQAEVVGITTVFGNAPVEHTTRNALRICELGKLDVPVARGMGRPLVGEAVHASDSHGATGLDGVDLPEPGRKPLANKEKGLRRRWTLGIYPVVEPMNCSWTS